MENKPATFTVNGARIVVRRPEKDGQQPAAASGQVGGSRKVQPPAANIPDVDELMEKFLAYETIEDRVLRNDETLGKQLISPNLLVPNDDDPPAREF